jgi:geranylgeranyl pyrophosphate synthase
MTDSGSLENNKIKPSKSLFLANQERLRECLYTYLAEQHPLLREDSIRAFMMPGKLLAQERKDRLVPNGSWALLSFLLTLMLAPETDLAVASRVAVAVECVICALDLLDDVEDEDYTQIVRELGTARTLNVSTALLMLAQRSLLSLQTLDVPLQKITQLLQLFEESIFVATMGQHRDLLAESRSIEDFTDEACIEIAAQKAGALMKLACVAAALCAGSNKETLEQCARLGELLGIAHQLDNDSHDLYHLIQEGLQYSASSEGIENESYKTDLIRHKKTLPIVIAMRGKKGGEGSTPQGDMSQQRDQALQEGIISAWGISLLYRERAQELFHTIEIRHTVSDPLRLLFGFTE